MRLKISDRVQQAISNGIGIVALESTIITHGMPWPQNKETALSLESIVREEGCEPATIAVFDGHIQVGISDSDLERLARTTNALKLSRADLAYAVSKGVTGSTTVAATMIAAHLAGIHYFATGGIGGVHRGGETSLDISADLLEFSRTPVTVVCAGAKAILDIGRTLEYLETLGVPVITYGSADFPAFWSRQSGYSTPLQLDSCEEICAFIHARKQFKLSGGVLIANPVPPEDEIPASVIGEHIEAALQDAHEQRIRAKEVTPFLLASLNERTQGDSLKCNIALVKNNARLAARLAHLRTDSAC